MSSECSMAIAVCVPWPPSPNDVLTLRQQMCLQNESQNSDCPLLMDALFQALLGSSLPRIPKERIRNLVLLSPLMYSPMLFKSRFQQSLLLNVLHHLSSHQIL